MKRQSVQKAYQNIRPDEEAKERMLQNILSSASEIPPAGKDDTMNRRKMKPVVIAAVIALMILMMGCALISLSLQELKIGENSSRGQVLDSDGNVIKESVISKRDVISLQGMKDTPGQMAAKEWYEFEKAYDVDGQWIGDAEAAGYTAPREYDAYFVYDQTMQDKVDEIAAKYDLKLAGERAMVQEWEYEIFFDSLGIESLHHPESQAEVEYGSGYFYECGNFSFDFWIKLNEADWPYKISPSMRYNDKEYLDTVYFSVDDINNLTQWNYTTSDGTEVLIAMDENYARIFCDREDAFVSAYFDVSHEYDSGEVKYMSKADVEAVADVLDFTVKPQKPDMDAAIKALEKSEQEHLAATEKNEYISDESAYQDKYGYREFIEAGIAAAKNPEKNYYVLMDIDGNGVVDLLLGGEEQCGAVWTVECNEKGYSSIKLLSWSMTEQEMEELNTAWPDMEKKPITEYFSE